MVQFGGDFCFKVRDRNRKSGSDARDSYRSVIHPDEAEKIYFVRKTKKGRT